MPRKSKKGKTEQEGEQMDPIEPQGTPTGNTPPEPIPVTPISTPPISQEATKTNDILNAALNKYKQSIENSEGEEKKNIEMLHNMISEYMNDYILLGHNVTGERIYIRNAKSPKEYDALCEIARKTFSKLMIEGNL